MVLAFFPGLFRVEGGSEKIAGCLGASRASSFMADASKESLMSSDL